MGAYDKHVRLSLVLITLVLALIVLQVRSGLLNHKGLPEVEELTKDDVESLSEWYKSSSSDTFDLEIVQVRNCEILLWHEKEGSLWMHFPGCVNPIHSTHGEYRSLP